METPTHVVSTMDLGTPVLDEWIIEHDIIEDDVIEADTPLMPPRVQRLPWPIQSTSEVSAEMGVPSTSNTVDTTFIVTLGIPWPIQSTNDASAEVGMPSTSTRVETKGTQPKKKRQVRSPVWFLEVQGACYVCESFIISRDREQHWRHVERLGVRCYEDAPLMIKEDLRSYVRLLNLLIREVMRFFGLTNRQEVIKYLRSSPATREERREADWSPTQLEALNLYFSTYGGTILPRCVTLNPPNSDMVLAHPRVMRKLMTKSLRRVLLRTLI